MLRVFIILTCLKIVNSEIITTPQTTPLGYQPLWKYDEESKWPGHRCKIGGRRQSPIDIKTENVIEDFKKLYIKHGPLVFKGYEGVLVTGINNGHTIQFSTEGDEVMHPRLSGGPLDTSYRLEQLHFHWKSEHAINGVKYPMEIHFVHVRSDLTVYDALSRKDGLAVIAVFCKVQSDLDDPPEQTKQLMEYIPRLKNTGDRISGVFLDMRKWLSPDRMSYYTYSGSLTSPKCNEAVTWIIFTVPLSVCDSQYQLIRKIGFGRHNSRALQNLSRHVVYCPPKTKIRVPHFITFFGDLFKTATLLFKNITTTIAHCGNLSTTYNYSNQGITFHLMHIQKISDFSSMSEFASQVVTYIAGSVVHYLIKTIKCETCISALLGPDNTNEHIEFIKLKDNRSLLIPSTDVVWMWIVVGFLVLKYLMT